MKHFPDNSHEEKKAVVTKTVGAYKKISPYKLGHLM